MFQLFQLVLNSNCREVSYSYWYQALCVRTYLPTWFHGTGSSL